MDRWMLTPFLLDQEDPGLTALARDGWETNRPELRGPTLLGRMAALEEAVARHVQNCHARGDRPVSIGGDCLQVLGIVAGYQRTGRAPHVLWLDAHGDFNTPATSPSGFVGGMPLAMLVGRGDPELRERLGLQPLDEAAVTLFDGRNLDPLERAALDGSRVRRATSLADLERLETDGAPLHLHLDCDIIDPQDAPAMLYPAPGGPRAEALARALAGLARRVRITSLSLSAWAPALDSDGATARVVQEVFAAALADGDPRATPAWRPPPCAPRRDRST